MKTQLGLLLVLSASTLIAAQDARQGTSSAAGGTGTSQAQPASPSDMRGAPAQAPSATQPDSTMSSNTLTGCLSGSAASGVYTLKDSSGTSYSLVGKDNELRPLVGTQVQVTGQSIDPSNTSMTSTSMSTSGSTTGSSTQPAGTKSFQVSGVTKVGETCAAGAGKAVPTAKKSFQSSFELAALQGGGAGTAAGTSGQTGSASPTGSTTSNPGTPGAMTPGTATPQTTPGSTTPDGATAAPAPQTAAPTPQIATPNPAPTTPDTAAPGTVTPGTLPNTTPGRTPGTVPETTPQTTPSTSTPNSTTPPRRS